MKNANKKVTDWFKRTGYLDTESRTTIDYNSDTSLADLETVDYNNNIRIDDLDIHLNINKIDLKKTSKNNRQLRELLKNTEI